MASDRRQRRVAEFIQRELAELIAYQLKDPRLHFVSVTRVEVSGDLRYARVYVSHLEGPAASKDILAALDHANGFLRRALGQRIQLRFMPELIFYFDEGLLASQRMNALLDEISQSTDPETDE